MGVHRPSELRVTADYQQYEEASVCAQILRLKAGLARCLIVWDSLPNHFPKSAVSAFPFSLGAISCSFWLYLTFFPLFFPSLCCQLLICFLELMPLWFQA